MKFRLLIFGISLLILNSSCGISTEVRSASNTLLVEQQKSLDAHIAFHSTTLKAINSILEKEIQATKDGLVQLKKNNLTSLLKEIDKIYADTTLTEIGRQKKIIEAKDEIDNLSQKGQVSEEETLVKLYSAKNLIQESSDKILAAEKAKTQAIMDLNEYLKQERPSEVLLSQVFSNFSFAENLIGQADSKLKFATEIMDSLNKTK